MALFDLVMQYRAIFSHDTEGEASREGARLVQLGDAQDFKHVD